MAWAGLEPTTFSSEIPKFQFLISVGLWIATCIFSFHKVPESAKVSVVFVLFVLLWLRLLLKFKQHLEALPYQEEYLWNQFLQLEHATEWTVLDHTHALP